MPRRIALLVASLVIAGLPVSAARAQAPAEPADPDRAPGEPLAPPPLDAEGVPIELALPPVSAVPQVRRLIAAGRDAEAAAQLEGLWGETGDPRFLVHAGLARARAGHHALALRHFARWLARAQEAGDASAAARAYVAERQAASRAAVVPVRLVLVEGPGGTPVAEGRLAGATIELEMLSPAGTPVPGAMFTVTGPLSEPLPVDPGAWRVRVAVPGYVPVERRFAAVGEGVWSVPLARQRVAVDLRLAPPKALRGARMTLRSQDNPAPVTLERDVAGPTQTVVLPTGAWRLGVASRRYEKRLDFAVAPGQGPIEVVLERRGAAGDERLRLERKQLVTVLGVFSASYFAGIGLLLGGVNIEGRAEKRDQAAREAAGVDPEATGPLEPAARAAVEAAFPTAEYHRRLALGFDVGQAGVVVVSSGLGALLGLMPVIFKKGRRELVIELAVGATLLASGATWMGLVQRDKRALLGPSGIDDRATEAAFDRLSWPRLGSGMLTGLGIGLVAVPVGYLGGLAAQRRKRLRSASVAPMVGPGRAGLMLGGAF